ncbi:MAG: putative PLP-dependent aminotransferase [Ginsengibacter sp.]
MTDYQWPHPVIDHETFLQNNEVKNILLYLKIEAFFSELFDLDVLLMPSGRSSISLLLQYFGTNRSKTIFTPKWTSHCVWDMITRLANPTIDCQHGCDTIIAVHKWGQIEKLSSKYSANIIEDSVDSIFTKNSTYFPNDGEFEIISLPKIIGSYTGGLILVKNKKNVENVRSYINQNIELGKHQSKLRFNYTQHTSTGYLNWEDRENQNTSLDTNALENIAACLNNYHVNKDVITKRLEYVSSKSSLICEYDRLPPVFCVEVNEINGEIDGRIMIRNKNFSGLLDKPDFRRVALIPLHFQANDEFFEFCVRSLCKN